MNAYDYIAMVVAVIAASAAILISFRVIDKNDHKMVKDDGTIRNIRMTDGGRMIDVWGKSKPKPLQAIVEKMFFWKLNGKKVVNFVDGTASRAFIDILTKPDKLSSIDRTKNRIV